MDLPRIRQSFNHRKLILAAGGLFLLSGVAFAIAKLTHEPADVGIRERGEVSGGGLSR